MAEITIALIPMLSDNYAWIIHDGKNAVVVDPGEAEPVLLFVKKQKLVLTHALITHHHDDHCGGVARLKKECGCAAIGAKDSRMLFIDDYVGDGDTRSVLDETINVIATPGHTKTHVVFHFPKLRALFTGDTLFSAGCGRVFEGTAQDMFQSLQKIDKLDDITSIYCGHEYTEENLMFAVSVEQGNKDVWERIAEVKYMQARNIPTVPSTLQTERLINPFLRTHEAAIKKFLHMESSTDAEVFAELRKRKDAF